MISQFVLAVFALFLAVPAAYSASKADAGATLPSEIASNLILQKGQREVSLAEALASVHAGQIVILGEQHGSLQQAAQQLEILENLRKLGHLVSVGMEFFSYTEQASVDSWRQGNLSEKEFLTQVGWGEGFSFDAYRSQVQFPKAPNEFLLALNAPRSLTGQIAKVGIDKLSSEEKALLPPEWSLGNSAYRRRFEDLMKSSGHLPSPEVVDRYFAAQSTWDETMAWKASQFMREHPEQVLVIIVGEFHVQYEGGLPDRLKAHGHDPLSFSLLNLEGATVEEQHALVEPSPVEGVRADFVWTSRFQ